MRVKWVFDSTKEMRSNGQLDLRAKLDKLKEEVMQNEERLKNVILAKVTHPDLAPKGELGRFRMQPTDELKAFFDDQTIIQTKPQTGE